MRLTGIVASGFRRRIEDGRLVLRSVTIANFVFQRIFRINGDCPWAVHYTSQVIAPENIRLGHRSAYCFATSGNCYIQAFNGIEFGDRVMFAPGVKIISADHDASDALWTKHITAPSIRIGDRCWIGANAVILPGVTLGHNVVVGAGAVVTNSFPDGAVVVGNPASILRIGSKPR